MSAALVCWGTPSPPQAPTITVELGPSRSDGAWEVLSRPERKSAGVCRLREYGFQLSSRAGLCLVIASISA